MIAYNPARALWWPIYDTKQDGVYAAAMRNLRIVPEVMRRVADTSLCIVAGGHVGLFPRAFSTVFDEVITFEPDAACYMALTRNAPTVKAYYGALGSRCGGVSVSVKDWSSETTVSGSGAIPMYTIDMLELQHCGLIFLDVEGYETEVLKGARDTIKKHRPVVVIEELKGTTAPDYLKSIGYTMQIKIKKDSIWLSSAV